MATVKLNLKPFKIPNFVPVEEEAKPRQEGFSSGTSYALSALSNETLNEMCADFKAGVFAKAGRPLR